MKSPRTCRSRSCSHQCKSALQSPLNNVLFISSHISSYKSQFILFTPREICASITLEKQDLHLVPHLLVRVAVHLVHANGDLRTITFEQQARHPIRRLLIRVAVHLVHAKANLRFNQLLTTCSSSRLKSPRTSRSPSCSRQGKFASINLEEHALHLVRNLLARVALHLVHAKPNLPSISLEQRPSSRSMSPRTCRSPSRSRQCKYSPQSTLNYIRVISFEISSHVSNGTLFTQMQICCSITLNVTLLVSFEVYWYVSHSTPIEICFSVRFGKSERKTPT